MDEQSPKQKDGPAIREIYPTLTEDELKEAEANFRHYLEIALRVQKEQGSDANFDTSPTPATIEERSNANLKN